jgi:hypothetical protein
MYSASARDQGALGAAHPIGPSCSFRDRANALEFRRKRSRSALEALGSSRGGESILGPHSRPLRSVC